MTPISSCVVVIVTHFLIGVQSGLTINKHCGDVICQKYQYCNSDTQCDDCEKICDTKSHNYELSNCEDQCQDFIHDHVRSYVNASVFAQLKGTVETLQSLVVISLTLSIFLLLVIGGILAVGCYRYRQLLSSDCDRIKKTKEINKKIMSVNVINSGGNNNESNPENRLSLKIPPPVPDSERGCIPSAVTTATTLSTRHPSEDNTLEYAYDNPALTPSPGTNLRRTETTF